MHKKRKQRKQQRMKSHEIELIREHRPGENGENVFLVKWKNVSEASNTWEPANTFMPGSKKLLDAYIKKHINPTPSENPEENPEREEASSSRRRVETRRTIKDIQKIVKKCVVPSAAGASLTNYCIKFKEHLNKDDEWLGEEDLKDVCPVMIEQFEKKFAELRLKKRQKKKERDRKKLAQYAQSQEEKKKNQEGSSGSNTQHASGEGTSAGGGKEEEDDEDDDEDQEEEEDAQEEE